MNPREKKMALVILSAVALGAGYQIVNYALAKPYAVKRTEVARLVNEEATATHRIERNQLSQQWRDFAGRTISFDANETESRLSNYLAKLAREHHWKLNNPLRPGAGPGIGAKSGVRTVEFRIAATAEYPDVVAFMHDLYASEFLCQVTKLEMKPVPIKEGRNRVKIENLWIETPLLPQIDASKIPQAAQAKAMDTLPVEGPARAEGVPAAAYATLSGRNVFRMYVPPPQTIILVDNQDRKTVSVTAKFFWENAHEEQPDISVPGTSKQFTIKGQGDAAEATVVYDDKHAIGPIRFDEGKKPWVLTVPSHTPPPPPETVDLAIDNQHAEPIDVNVEVSVDGRKITKPTMRIKGKTRMDIDTYKASSIAVTCTYASGKVGAQQTFQPAQTKQTVTVPQESAGQVVVNNQPPPPSADKPPDANLMVNGLVTATAMDGPWFDEGMYVMDPKTRQRKFVPIGGEVDDGTLIGRHSLGGVVKMPATGNYYLYPLGQTFTKRVLLQARADSELATAIAAWSKR